MKNTSAHTHRHHNKNRKVWQIEEVDLKPERIVDSRMMKNFSVMLSIVLLLTSCLTASMAFTTITQTTTTTASAISDSRSQSSFTNTRVYAGDDTSDATPDSSSFEIEVSVPPKRSNVVARLKFPSVFSYNSEYILVVVCSLVFLLIVSSSS